MSKTKTAVGTPDPDETPFATGGIVPTGQTRTMPSAGEVVLTPEQVGSLREPAPVVVLDTVTAAEALAELRRLRDEHAHVIIRAQVTGKPTDQEVAEGHAFDGTRHAGRWHFTASSFDMARRVAGWRKVEHLGEGQVELS